MNLKTILYITIAFAILMLSSCGKCTDENIQKCAFGNEVDKYFGVYKPGNWWVYVYEGGDLRDSICVTNYREYSEKEKEPCVSYPFREYTLHSFYYLKDNIDKNVVINMLTGSKICQYNVASFYTSNGLELGGFKIEDMIQDTMLTVNGKSYQGISYPNIEGGLYSKDIGLSVFYSANNELFYLTNYHINE